MQKSKEIIDHLRQYKDILRYEVGEGKLTIEAEGAGTRIKIEVDISQGIERIVQPTKEFITKILE